MDINIPPGETIEEAQAAEPITFTIVGHLRVKGKLKEQTYTYSCNPDYPFGAFLDFLQSVGTGGGGARMLGFITACLVDDEERERFTAMLDQTNEGLRLNPDLLDLLATQLIAAYTDRPTRLPTALAGGQSRGAKRSVGAANGRG